MTRASKGSFTRPLIISYYLRNVKINLLLSVYVGVIGVVNVAVAAVIVAALTLSRISAGLCACSLLSCRALLIHLRADVLQALHPRSYALARHLPP